MGCYNQTWQDGRPACTKFSLQVTHFFLLSYYYVCIYNIFILLFTSHHVCTYPLSRLYLSFHLPHIIIVPYHYNILYYIIPCIITFTFTFTVFAYNSKSFTITLLFFLLLFFYFSPVLLDGRAKKIAYFF